MRRARWVPAALLCLTVLLTACSSPSTPAPPPDTGSGFAPGAVPISPAGFLGQFNLSSSSYAMANRFVVDEDVTIDRWYYAMNGEGADCVDGRNGYGAGDGGIEFGRIVDVDPMTGLPGSQVLAAEKVNGCTNHERTQEEFGLSETHQVHYIQFPAVPLEAGKMYAFVLSNDDPNPGSGRSTSDGNYMSPNLNFADLDDMGPHGSNTLDPDATGAAYGLDPRETTMWSDDSGATWKFGDEVGWYDVGNGDGRMWPGGYRIAGGANVPNGWTYMNWPSEGEASITYTASATQTLTTAGGASRNGDVGSIVVENLATGQTASTEDFGDGLVSGALDRPLPVEAGQQYVVRSDGEVGTGSAEFWDRVFDFSSQTSAVYQSKCSECSDPRDHPMLYASAAAP
jgi:hypothetical protein